MGTTKINSQTDSKNIMQILAQFCFYFYLLEKQKYIFKQTANTSSTWFIPHSEYNGK